MVFKKFVFLIWAFWFCTPFKNVYATRVAHSTGANRSGNVPPQVTHRERCFLGLTFFCGTGRKMSADMGGSVIEMARE